MKTNADGFPIFLDGYIPGGTDTILMEGHDHDGKMGLRIRFENELALIDMTFNRRNVVLMVEGLNLYLESTKDQQV